jgi:hypothetical protein
MSILLSYKRTIASIKDATQLQIETDKVTKTLVKHYDDLMECGWELGYECDAYEEQEYRDLQQSLSDEMLKDVHRLHNIYEEATRHGITLHKHAIACMQENNTSSKNYGNCKICKCNIHNGRHYHDHYNHEHLLTINDC